MENILKDKSYTFALKIVNLYKFIIKKHKEYVLSKQMLRSGTSVGALVYEAQYAQSKKDFVNKLSISLKEANETCYWLNLLKDANYISEDIFEKVELEVTDLIRILTSSINTTKKNIL